MIFRMVHKSGQIFLPFCHNARVWQTDRRTNGGTDGQTKFSSLDCVCIPCSAVKTFRFITPCKAYRSWHIKRQKLISSSQKLWNVDIIRTACYIHGPELMKLIFAVLYMSWTMGLKRCCTRNSSEDEIANVKILYDDIVHVLQNGTHVYRIQ